LAQDVLKSGGPESVTSEKGADPLSLQSRCLGHRREEVETTRLAGTTTNVRGGGNARVVIPDSAPAKTSELIKLSRRRRGEAEFIPQTAEEQGGNTERTALKRQSARKNILRDSFQLVVEGSPVFLNPIRGENQIIAQHPNRGQRIVEYETKVRSPLRKRVDGGGKRHVARLGEVDAAVGSTTIFSQGENKNTTIRKSDANGGIVSIGPSDKRPPREANTLKPCAERHQQRLKGQVEQERGKGVALANPASNRNRSNRMTIVHEESGSVGVSDSEGVLDKGRETKLSKDSRKIRVGDPVVSFFLIKEDERTIHRAIGSDSLVSSVTKNVTHSHGNISGIAIFSEASLMGRNQSRKNRGETGRKQPREDLNIAVGKRDRPPIGNGRKVTARLGNKGNKGARPRRRSRASRQDRIEEGKKDRDEGVCKRLIPFIRNTIRTRGTTERKSLNRGQQFVSSKRNQKGRGKGRGKGREGNGRKERMTIRG